LVAIFEQVVSGRSLRQRPGLEAAVAAVADGTADGVIVSKLDGLRRGVGDFSNILSPVARLDPRHEITLVRNRCLREWSRAAQPSGNPDVIVERFGGTADAGVRSVLHGTADLATGNVPRLRGYCSCHGRGNLSELKQNPWVSTWFIALNTRVPPFDNLDARRAFNVAVDRQHVRDLTRGQGARPAPVTKVLTFEREDPDLPVISGVSGRDMSDSPNDRFAGGNRHVSLHRCGGIDAPAARAW
jgi:hypothetical protein